MRKLNSFKAGTRFGSLADISERIGRVRVTPESGHDQWPHQSRIGFRTSSMPLVQLIAQPSGFLREELRERNITPGGPGRHRAVQLVAQNLCLRILRGVDNVSLR